MRVQIYVQKKEEDREFHLAADVDPSMFGLQDTLAEIVAKATFHEWSQVAMKFVYPEAVKRKEPVEKAETIPCKMEGQEPESVDSLLKASERMRAELATMRHEGISADSAHDMGKTQEDK